MRNDPYSELLREDLSEEMNVVMLTRVRYSTDFLMIQKFAISLIISYNSKVHTILRYDGSIAERVHVHHFFKNPPEKEYHNREVNYETVQYYHNKIRQNWRLYVAEFKQNYI